MTLAKVKEQDGMTLVKVRHAQVSYAHTEVPSILHQRLVIISQMSIVAIRPGMAAGQSRIKASRPA